ncbi:MAG: phosphoenolpyruvate synthase [Desulfovibrio sp.]|nr:phosphoenolpyruvate synthase [Desulfovibrio sp.]
MILSKMLGLLKRKRALSENPAESDRAFALRHNSFRLFLKEWNRFQETMTEVEYTLCCDHPFGLHRVRELCTAVATQVFQCIANLKRLDPAACAALTERFSSLQKAVSDVVYPRETPLDGPFALPFGKALGGDEGVRRLIDPTTLRLESLRGRCGEVLPEGFVVTAAGCQRFCLQPELDNEIMRRIQAAGGISPGTLRELCVGLRELVLETPLPGELADAVLSEVRALRERTPKPIRSLLLKGRLWPLLEKGKDGDGPDAAKETPDPGLALWGPSVSLDAPDEEILSAMHRTLARKQEMQALMYRRARGLTEKTSGFCIAFLAVEDASLGGLACCCETQAGDGGLPLRFCSGLPKEPEDALPALADASPSTEGSQAPPEFGPAARMPDSHTEDSVSQFAEKLRSLFGAPFSLCWSGSSATGIRLVHAALMPPSVAPSTDPSEMPAPLLRGETAVGRGRTAGIVKVVRTWADAKSCPKGAILVVPNDAYAWAALVEHVAGVVAERGMPCSALACLAREFGKPAVFNAPEATRLLTDGQKVTLCADTAAVYEGQRDSFLAGGGKAPDYMPGSPVYRRLQHAGEHILPLTLDVDSVDFSAANCRTYHDIGRFCHEKAVSAMFSMGSAKKCAPRRVKQLYDGVPKQFWVVNLGDGFSAVPSGPLIDIGQIASVPLQALWKGMNAEIWQGPPPVDGKGFLSVLFEATANPDLEPSSQSTYFSEKNYFLVTRDYCSLHSRFGFHFVSVEATLGERSKENSILFRLRGGAADIRRRILRVRFVADLLWEFGFKPAIRNDAVSARLEGMDVEEGRHLLAVAGYMTIHTRQLDMIMQDTAQVARRHDEMLARCRALFTGKAL